MRIEMDEKNKTVCIWLSSDEKKRCENALKEYYARMHSQGVKVCVFISGEGDLLSLTQDLLRHNRFI